ISLAGSSLLALLQEATALKVTLYMYSSLAIICAIIAAITYSPVPSQLAAAQEKSVDLKEYGKVLKMPEVWAIGLIGFAAYTASTGVTYLQPYLADVFGLSAATSSVFAIIAKNCALVAAPIITWIAIKAKIPVTKVLGYSLILASVCFIIYILMPTQTLILALCIVFYMVSAL
ncbi:hypothetical protein L3K73_13990, partial [Holdemanella sp. SCCA2]|nr:hypothetical protein [Holdemanella sp. SCCA2]